MLQASLRARQRWLDLVSESPAGEYLGDLAWFLVDCPDPNFREPKQALTLAQRALKESPGCAAYRNTLGAAHYRSGQWKESVDSLQEAVRLRGSEHPRDEDGKFTFGGGGAEFVSPNVESDLDIGDAVSALSGAQQTALKNASRDIDRELKLDGQQYDAVGAWLEGTGAVPPKVVVKEVLREVARKPDPVSVPRPKREPTRESAPMWAPRPAANPLESACPYQYEVHQPENRWKPYPYLYPDPDHDEKPKQRRAKAARIGRRPSDRRGARAPQNHEKYNREERHQNERDDPDRVLHSSLQDDELARRRARRDINSNTESAAPVR